MSAPVSGIIAILERALDDARSGRTQAIAFAQIGYRDANGGEGEHLTCHSWPDGDIAMGELLQRAIAKGFDEVTTDVMEERAQALAEAVSQRPAGVDAAVWAALKADYLRLERPSWSACYWRARQVAEARGLTLPSSTTLHRRLKREVPTSVIVLRRQGAGALIP